MSEAEAQFGAAGARELRARAAAWLERRDSAEWNLNDQAELDAWLAESPANIVAYLRADDAWKRADRLSALGRPTNDIAAPARNAWAPMLKIAAVLGVVAVLGAVSSNIFLRPHERMFSTPVGGRETVSFADGSRIELNTNTVLRARMTTEERVVWLDRGEAFFQIRHDAAHPFVVMAGDHRVTDLGTQFTVRREPRRMEVAVIQGRVSFDRPDAPPRTQVVLLMPGDVAIATAQTMRVTKASERSLTNELAWRRGVLVFDKTTLADAATQFNRYNGQKLIVSDPAVASMTIDGTFKADNLSDFTRLVKSVLGLRIESRGNDIVIRR